MLPMQRAVWLVETHQNHEAVSVAGGKMPRMEAWLILTLSTKLGLRILASMRQLIQPPLIQLELILAKMELILAKMRQLIQPPLNMAKKA